ncbi:hypothetical protein PCASD_12645 [Puccinia coronata f. sp. avenae]|uniref:Uncharacterized protein n=1 Tax=Puccinia coronata f. sp. avenae TaxID=200324 RepID=A0A2N5UAP8_9BASI|nr:hypothetical protein PCASD_12645 [Puccinia coronata f. sp. avenae]
MATTSIPSLISKVVPKPLRKSKSKSLQAFGDFFVRENRSTGIKAERPSKYTSVTLSEDFKREAEKVYVTKLINSATWKMDLRLLPIMAMSYFSSKLGCLSINNIHSIGKSTSHHFSDMSS